jgi:hypothetical protein
MKIAIIGSRDYPNLQEVQQYVQDQLNEADVVISGGARGVDRTAEMAAKARGLKTEIYLPDWQRYGKPAGIKRNLQMIDACDFVVAFYDGSSKGTRFTIDEAIKRGKLLQVFQSGGNRMTTNSAMSCCMGVMATGQEHGNEQ